MFSLLIGVLTVLLFPLKILLSSLIAKSENPNETFLDRLEGKLLEKVNLKNAVDSTKDVAKKGIDTGKNAVKKTGKAVKNTGKNIKKTAKATKDVAKNTAKAAKTTAKVAKNTGKATVAVAKIAIKGLITTIKAIISLIQTLIAIIASCEVIAIVLLVLVCIALVAAVVITVIYVINNGEFGSHTVKIEGNSTVSTVQGSNASLEAGEKWRKDWFQGSEPWGGDYWLGKDDNGNLVASTVAGSGCGGTCTGIVANHYGGDDYDVSLVRADFEKENRWSNLDSAIIPYWFNTLHPELGLKCSDAIYCGSGGGAVQIDLDLLDKTLANGGCAIIDTQSNTKYNGISIWTGGGHYVVVVAGNQKDGYAVRDPNGNHDIGGSGVADWAPYNSHTFPKEYIQAWYWYTITPTNTDSTTESTTETSSEETTTETE